MGPWWIKILGSHNIKICSSTKKTRARIQDPRKRDILAPLEPPHALGTTRPSLKQDYYEQINKPHIDVIDIKANPTVEVKPDGLVTADGKLHEIETTAFATDLTVTGGMMNMGLQNTYAETLAETWDKGTWSYLGMTCNGYSNMFFMYGGQGPTAFPNRPSCVVSRGDWIIDAIKMKDEKNNPINPTKAADRRWQKKATELSDKTLFPSIASGTALYEKEIMSSLKSWDGSEVAAA